jgi:hypothetical protein
MKPTRSGAMIDMIFAEQFVIPIKVPEKKEKLIIELQFNFELILPE